MDTPTVKTSNVLQMPENETSAINDEEIPEAEVSSYPPYPPYPQQTAPPSVAETIIAGRNLRRKFKYSPQKSVRPLPKTAKPRGPKATDVKMSHRAYKAHSKCLRRHGAVLTDRLEYMAKPRRRNIIYLWREYAHILPPETIARIRSMLDADEPFKPEQAYEYFVNLRKTKKKRNKKRMEQIKKDMIAIYDNKRFLWARNATIAFARGIQQRLLTPGRYALADGMLQLSNVILHDVCGFMKMRTPSRNFTNPKARFMMEMSDKIAVWIDEILMESNDRMLMMDFDEDEEEVERSYDDDKKPEATSEVQSGGMSSSEKNPPADRVSAPSSTK